VLAIIFQFSGRLAKWLVGFSCLALVIVTIVTCSFAQKYFPLHISPYKPLAIAMKTPGALDESTVYNQHGMVSIVKNAEVPFRYAPDLSLQYQKGMPKQIAIFRNGESMTVINQAKGALHKLEYVNNLPSALAYELLDKPNVVIIGAGGGTPVWQARLHHASTINVVESNPRMTQLLTFSRLDDILYDDRSIFVYPRTARGFFADNMNQYELIHLSRINTGLILSNIQANYTLTEEALAEYFDHLSPNGILTISLTLQAPAISAFKLMNMIRDLDIQKIDQLDSHLAIIRGGQTVTFIMKKSKLSQQEIVKIKSFSQRKKFDLLYYPGIKEDEIHKESDLTKRELFEGVATLLGEKASSFSQNYLFNISSATDESPYFSDSFRWRSLPQLWSQRHQGALIQAEWSYLIVFLTLILVFIISLFAIYLPLYAWSKKQHDQYATARVSFYFLSIGLAFMFIEASTLQRLQLILHNSIEEFEATLTGILVFAGLGGLSVKYVFEFMLNRKLERLIMMTITSVLLSLILAYTFILPNYITALFTFSHINHPLKAILSLAPIAFFMGMPFSLGLAWVATYNNRLIPWAWAINSAASVIGMVLATLLLLHIPATTLNLLAIVLYSTASTLLIRGKSNVTELRAP